MSAGGYVPPADIRLQLRNFLITLSRVLRREVPPSFDRGVVSPEPDLHLEWALRQVEREDVSRVVMQQLSARIAPAALLPILDEWLVPQRLHVDAPRLDRPVAEALTNLTDYFLRTILFPALAEQIPLLTLPGMIPYQERSAAAFRLGVQTSLPLLARVISVVPGAQATLGMAIPAAAHAELLNPGALAGRIVPLVTEGAPHVATRHPKVLEALFIAGVRVVNRLATAPVAV
jgi:hypothetical protein